MLETQTMNSRSNKHVSQRRMFWFAIALAVAVSGLGRSAAAQKPSPRAQKSVDDAASRKRDEQAAPKARPEVLAYPSEETFESALEAVAFADEQLSKYSLAGNTINDVLTNFQYTFKYQDPLWSDDLKGLFAPKIGGVGIGKGVGLGSGLGVIDGHSQSADDDPCEFKIVVLQALIQNDPPRGIAVATDWLKPGSSQTVRCKGAALTLLARHAGKSATPVILGVARNETDLKLRTKAISVLGATNDDSVIDALRDFALNSTVTDISEAALYALSQHNSERAMGVLAEIATSNRPVPLRRAAIANISSRPGEPAVDMLLKIYDADQNIEIRKSAINAIARRSGEQAVDILLGLYDNEKNDELKDQIIGSLAGSNDPRVTRKLIDIAKNPQTPIERRKRAIGWLSRSKDPEVLTFLENLLKQ